MLLSELTSQTSLQTRREAWLQNGGELRKFARGDKPFGLWSDSRSGDESLKINKVCITRKNLETRTRHFRVKICLNNHEAIYGMKRREIRSLCSVSTSHLDRKNKNQKIFRKFDLYNFQPSDGNVFPWRVATIRPPARRVHLGTATNRTATECRINRRPRSLVVATRGKQQVYPACVSGKNGTLLRPSGRTRTTAWPSVFALERGWLSRRKKTT